MHLIKVLHQQMDQQQLIRECRLGSMAAQKCLFDHYAPAMVMICARYVKNEQDAEEVMLDGFFKFFKNISKFQYHGDAATYSWLRKIMVNECLMFLRKSNAFIITAEISIVDTATLQHNVLDKLDAEEIYRMIVQLPVGYRTVFNLFVIEGLGHKEIAGLLDITEGTSKSQLAKARALLQKMLIQKNDTYAGRKIK